MGLICGLSSLITDNCIFLLIPYRAFWCRIESRCREDYLIFVQAWTFISSIYASVGWKYAQATSRHGLLLLQSLPLRVRHIYKSHCIDIIIHRLLSKCWLWSGILGRYKDKVCLLELSLVLFAPTPQQGTTECKIFC